MLLKLVSTVVPVYLGGHCTENHMGYGVRVTPDAGDESRSNFGAIRGHGPPSYM